MCGATPRARQVPIVGRDDELSLLLRRILDFSAACSANAHSSGSAKSSPNAKSPDAVPASASAAAARGGAAPLVVEGEAGMGKTRLTYALVEAR